ncbi:MAG: flavodoxin family protein [Oscillospiraceae bacterium]|nr:flavodoxin family protein [Oscillospiraceae bacterium]
MKALILNGSPRKNRNTAMMLRSVQKGAESVGAETEYIDLYDLQYTGCRSCMLCKRKGAERCRCYWKDDLSPLIDRIFAANALFIGSPIYLGDIISQVHALIERLHFCALSYDDYSNYFKGRINVGLIFTMNAPQSYFDNFYKSECNALSETFSFMNGSVGICTSCDTLQVDDYSKYSMAGFDEAHKKEMHDKQFPRDLEAAFIFGSKLCTK